jgi:VIT1/CCC1 family predicted Fe2+/Mn2+ transporter/rubrerythrin
MTKQESEKLIAALRDNYRREREGEALYRHLAETEKEPAKQTFLLRLSEAEGRHAARWAKKMQELGAEPPEDHLNFAARWRLRLARWVGAEATIRRQEANEDRDIGIYQQQRETFEAEVGDILREVQEDEQKHRKFLRELEQKSGPRAALDTILARERWHRTGHSWVGDAIYGANDGLGAVFGLVSGVAGYTSIAHWVLVSGLAGTIASALSMAAGAYLAAKSEGELSQAELAREEEEFQDNPAEEREELELIYQLKGFTSDEAKMLVDRLAERPEQFMKVMATEELGISEMNAPSPGRAAVSSGVSTALGAIIPVLPFFWLDGITAILVAALISLAAHFLVGAAKSLMTIRSWWSSGLEMMAVGAFEGVVTYGLGLAAAKLL